MEYPITFDADSKSSYLHECKDGWSGVPYEPWTIESNSCNPSPSSASPSALSLAPGCLSVEPMTNSFNRTRRSSMVSPTVSAWSDSVVTPPITPQRNERWYTLTPGEISLKSSTTSYLAIHDPMDVHIIEGDLWMPREWHLPSLSLDSSQELPRQDFMKPEINGDNMTMPFHSRAYDPALSRHIFSDMTSSPTCQSLGSYRFHWSHISPWSTPETIAPKVTVQTTTSSPLTKIESSSPFQVDNLRQCGIALDSSPLPVPSPCVVPSHSSIDNFRLLPDTNVTHTQPTLTRKVCERSSRRSQYRKAMVGTTCKPRKATDDIACDAVIHPNTFACNFPGCIDKSTGKQKRFKRQEHRKRHEITVHKTKGDKKYFCWVPGCTTVGFNRTDNLKNHIISTHGKNNPGKRNRYVATLDPASKYYNPSWQGELTDDGYPLIEGVTRHKCWISECEKSYHLEDKLKAHLLQQHGKKSTCSDTSVVVASPDENSDSPDSNRKGRVRKVNSVTRRS